MTSKGHEQSLRKRWEVIADDLSKAGCSSGCVSALDSRRPHELERRAGRRKAPGQRADQKLTAFVELEAVIDITAMSFA